MTGKTRHPATRRVAPSGRRGTASHLQSRQKSTKQNDTGELNTILQSLLHRLDIMDQNLIAMETQQTSHTNITPLLNIDTRPPTGPTTGPTTSTSPTRSNNPDFGDMWKSLFRAVQLQHHLKNWEKTPTSIGKKFKELGESITPPSPSTETSNIINNIMLNAGEQTRQCITAHIEKCILNNRAHLAEINPTDKNKAKQIAEKHLKRRLGSKLTEAFLKKTLDTEMRYLTRENPVNGPLPQIINTDIHNPNTREWITVSKKNKKRQQPETSPLSPSSLATQRELDNDGRTRKRQQPETSPLSPSTLATIRDLENDLKNSRRQQPATSLLPSLTSATLWDPEYDTEPSDTETGATTTNYNTPFNKHPKTATTPSTHLMNLKRFTSDRNIRHDPLSPPFITHNAVTADPRLRNIRSDQIPKTHR